MTEAQPSNAHRNPVRLFHQKPEFTPVHVECLVDMSEYGLTLIVQHTWRYARFRSNLVVSNSSENVNISRYQVNTINNCAYDQ